MPKVKSATPASRAQSADTALRATARQVRDKFTDIGRLTPLMAAVLAAVSAMPAYAQVAANANALILRQGVGQTATSLAVNGTTTDVRTKTIVGANAFNSFTRFEVGGGNTVNLHLPTGTSNLVNLVSDSAVRVNGTVNSLLSSGKVGGNVIFADPYGFVVGASGILNVGSLAVSTPSMAGMDRLFGAAAGTDAAAVADLQAGKLGFSSLGVIRIEGRINALDNVSLQTGDGEGNGASAIDVSGTVRAGGAGRTQVAVNVGGSQAVELVQSEGRIVLTAGGDIKVTGKLLADGDPWAKAGAIRVTAGRDLTLGGTTQISASSNTGNAAGGDVYLWGERNATAADGLQISARASGTGDGGRIEISGRKSIDLGRVSFDASSPQGKAGEVFIDPEDLTISDARVSAGTNFTAEADNSITVSGSVTTTNPDGHSGNITLTAPNITLTSTGLLDASASTGYTAGDVTLTASKPANELFPATSTASISIDGVIKGKDITAVTDARVNNGQTVYWEVISALTGLAGIFGAAPIGGAYIPAEANATIDLGGSANLSATGNVSLSSFAQRESIYTSTAASKVAPFAVSVLVGNLTGTTSVNVGSGVSISAGGNVGISAASRNITKLVSNAVSGATRGVNGVTVESESGVAVAATISLVDTSTTIDVASGSHITGAGISALAKSDNSSQTATNAYVFGNQGTMGAAFTVSINNNAASTKVGGTLTATHGNVSLGALSQYNTQDDDLYYAGHSTSASTKVVQNLGLLGTLSDLYQGLNQEEEERIKFAVMAGAGAVWDVFGKQKTDKANPTASIKAASAVSFDLTTISSKVEVLPNAVITADNGNVLALAVTTNASLSLTASSTAVSKLDDEGGTSKVAVSAGIVVGEQHQYADVLIGSSAQISAKKIGISANTESARKIGLSSIDDFPVSDLFQGQTIATTSGDAKAAVAGTAMVVSSDSRSTAWVDDHARLVATEAVTSDESWSVRPYALNAAYGVSDTADWSFGKSVNVSASIGQKLAGLGGSAVFSSTSGDTAVGGTFNWMESTNTAIAGIGDFVSVTAPSVQVSANTANWVKAFSPTAGVGDGMVINGVAATVWIDNTTHASISNKALVTADEVDVVARQRFSLWSASGSFNMGSQGGVGLAVAYSDVTANTRAYVGDNSADHPGSGYTTADVALGSEAAGLITTDSLQVEALSQGTVGTISVALAVAGGTKGGQPSTLGAWATYLGNGYTKLNEFGQTAAHDPAPARRPEYTIAAAGAAAVTATNVDTLASIEGATIHRKAETGVSNSTVLALANVNQWSVAGGIGVSMNEDETSKSNTGIAGSISLLKNKAGGNGNETRASIVNSTLTGQGADHVQALSGGDLISVGVGAAGFYSTTGESNSAMAGSVSLTVLANHVSASVSNSTLSAASGSSTDLLDVVAYDRTRIGTGGGAMTLFGSKGAGAALTYTELANTVSAGISSGSTVTDFETVDVRAMSNNRIIAGAMVATVAMGDGSTSAGGASVLNNIANTVTAAIEGGSHVTGATTVTVTAAGAPNGDNFLDTALGLAKDNGIVDFNADNPDGGYSNEFKSAAQGGDAIIGVAGGIQVSSGDAASSSYGLSFSGNIINNTYEAAIVASTVTASGAVNVSAKNTAKILGVAAGLGASTGDFAGVGSGTVNIIGSNVTAAVRNAANITAGSLSVDASATGDILSVAGSVAISKGSTLGAALAYNQTSARTFENLHYDGDTEGFALGTTTFAASGVRALVDHATVNVAGGAFDVQAQKTGEIKTIAAAGAGSGAPGSTVAGSLTWNVVGDTAKALVSHSGITAGTSRVSVGDDADGAAISSFAGALAVSKGGTGVGGAFAVNDITSTRSATAESSTFDLTGAATFDAGSSAAIQTLSAAIAGSSTSGAVGASISLNMIDATLEAGTTGGRISGATSVNIHAHNSSAISATAGAVGLSLSSGAMGGAISTNLIGSQGGNVIKAGIDGGSVTTANGNITVNAEGAQTIGSIAVAGSGAATVALAGSASANTIDTAITAKVSDATLVAGTGDVFVDASDSSSIHSMAPALAIGGSTAVGVSVAVNRIGTATSAWLTGGYVRARDVILDAEENADIKTVAIGAGAGGSNGGAGSVVVNILTGSTTAKIENGANVLAQGDVAVLANDSGRIEAVGGALAIGAGAAALGAVSVTNLLQNTTDAHITGSTTSVTALSLGGRSLIVNSATLASAPDLSTVSGVNRAVLDDSAAFGTRTANGVVVNATALQRIGTVAANVAGSGGPAAVGLLASVDAVSGSTKAYIENATINGVGNANSSQTVDVQAANHAMVADFAAGAAPVVSGVGVNATVATVSIDRTTDAHIKTGTVKAAGAVSVNARSSESEVVFAFGAGGGLFGGVSANAASALIQSTTKAYVGDEGAGSNTTSVQAGSLNITARADNMINLIAGGVAGGAVGIGASVGVGLLGGTVKAYGSHLTTDVSGALTVSADTENKLQSVVVNAAGGTSSGASFMAAVNIMDSETQAYLNSVSQTGSTPTSITVAGTENLTLGSYGGALGGGGAAGYGVSANVAIAKSTLLAEILNSELTSSGSISVTADRNATAELVTATAGLSGGVSIAGSVGVVVMGGAPDSSTNNTLDSGGSGTLSKADTASNSDRAGDSNGAMTAEETAAVNTKSSYALKSSVNDNNAQGSTATVVGSVLRGSSLSVRAVDNNTVTNGAGAVAVGGSTGAGAGIAVSILGNTASATMVGGSATTTGNVSVSASNESDINTYAVTAAASGSLGFAASIGVNQLSTSTRAGVSGSTLTSSAGSVLLNASSTDVIKTVGAGAAVAGATAAAGSVVVNTLTSDTSAFIDSNATVTAYNNVGVLAFADDLIEASGGALGVGVGAVGIGAVSVVNILKGTTDAHISGAGTQVTANANDVTYITVKDSTLQSTPDLSSITDVSRAVFADTTYNTRNARGVVVNAASIERVGTVGVNVAASLGAAAGIVINVDQVAGSTKAYIDGASTTSGKDVDVRAADNALVADFATGVSIGGAGAGNGALNTALMSRITSAYINGGSTTASSGAVAVNARSTQAQAVLSAGVAGGAFAGVSATSSVARSNAETKAYIDNNTLTAASLSVTARGDNLLHVISGSLGVGAVGIGGSVGVAISDSTVKAYVEDSTLTVTGALGVTASTVTSLDQTVVNAGAGAVGVGIMAGVALLSNTTEARLENVTQTANASTVTVAASDSMTVSDKGGSSAIGAVGVGVAANVLVASSRTDAKVIDSTLKASGAVNVSATRDADLQLYTMTASAGALVGVSASVGVIALGQAPNSETNSDTSGTLGNVNSVTTADRTGNTNGAMSSGDTTSSNAAASYQTQTKVNSGAADATTATIAGGSVTSGGLNVTAAQHVDTLNMAGGVAGGYFGAGAGAAVAVTNYGSVIEAAVSGTTVTQGAHAVTVQATSDDKNSGTTRDKANRVITFAGGAGFVGIGAAVGIATNNTQVHAGLAGTVTASSVNVTASDSASVKSEAYGAALGSGAVGVARADATNTGTVIAEIGGSISTSGAVNITASRSGDTAANTVAGAAGIIAGAGADAHATSSGNVTARINDSATVNSAGQIVSVSASDSADARAQSIAAAVAILGTVGVSTSTASLDANVTAKLGSNASVTAAGLNLSSASDGSGVSYSTAAGGGLLFGANAVVSQTHVGGDVLTQVGGGSIFNITGDVNISAADTLSGKATSIAVQGGFVAVGAAVSHVTVGGTLTTDAGGVSGITGSVGGALNVSAVGQEFAEANATAGSGGVIAGAAAVALTDTSRTTSTKLTYGNAGTVATAGAISVSADGTANVTGHVDSLQASLVGAAGGSVTHTINNSVSSALGDASNLTTHALEITAHNAVLKPSQASDVSAGSGGVVGAAAALSNTNITGLSSLAQIGNNAHVTVTGTYADPGTFNVAARNNVDASAAVKLIAAGLIVGAGGEANIHATGDSSVGGLLATASMGSNSSVDVLGNITFSALSQSKLNASTSTSTYGLAAAAAGDANAIIANTNNVTIGTGSTITGTNYVSFLAGVDSSGRTNVASANSTVDLYNKTAFPISATPNPTSAVDVNNNITINANSVRTAGTVYLTTEEGTHITKAKGTGKDLYTEALKAAGDAFGIDLNLELNGGNASRNNVTGVVRLNGGTIEAGANNIQRITFDENGNVVTATKVGNISFTKSVEDLVGNGVAYLNKLYEQKAEYGANTQIDALIAYYETQLIAGGFADTQARPDGSTYVTARDSVPANYITLNDVYARSGNIVVAANRFGGTGSLIANADNEITIINNSPYQLRVKDLIIDSTGGFIKFNGANVRTNAGIAALNPRTGGPVPAFGTMQSLDPSGGAGSVQPIINLSSNWSPAVQPAATSDDDATAKLAADPLYDDRGRAPDIRVAGHLYNRLGAVNVSNTNGSVIIAPDVAGYTPLIEGATTNVSAGREVFLDSPTAFYSIGGDPKSLYLGTFTPDDVTRVRAAGLSGNVCASGNVLSTAGNPITSLETDCYHAGAGGIFASGSVFLSAKYLNINGTVQSGQHRWNATLPESQNTLMDTWRANYLRVGGTSRFLLTEGSLRNGIPTTYYNAATDRIELAPTAATGGSVNLVGYIMNTGGGEIKVMDGHGHIAVTNNTNRAIDILGLDTGNVSGKVVITDLGKSYLVGGKTVNAVTTISSTRNTAGVPTYTSVTTQGRDGAVLSNDSNASNTFFSYNPLANTTYSWLSGFAKTLKSRYYWKSSSYLWTASGGWDKEHRDSLSVTGDPSQPPIPLVEAEYVSTTTPGIGNNFNVTWASVTTDAATMTGSRNWHKCGFLCFKRTNYRTEDWVTGKKDLFTTSVRADRAIPISFIGYDSGLLNVTSLTGDINIAGAITNKFGAVNLTSTGGSITQTAAAAQITADSISLVSANGIGTNAGPINVQILNTAGGIGLNATTGKGDIVLNSTGTADLLVGKIVTPVANGGHVTVKAYNGIIGMTQAAGVVNIEGAKIDLNSTVGAIGSAGTALTIKTRDDSYLGGLSATAAQDINIKQPTGNLWLNRIESSGGNVTLEAGAGSIYDGNHTAVRDQRTYDELLGAWNKMSLRSADPAANAAALQVQLDAVKIRNNQAYKDYWAMRGAAAYNPDFQYSASASEIAALALDTSAKVTAYNNQKTTTYQTTHARLVATSADATFNPSYSYTLTAQEISDLSTGSSWTDAQLATSMPKGLLFKENANTITLIKENNVISNQAVTLKASGTIGRYDGQMIIDPRTPMSDDQKVALTGAETKDVSFQYFSASDVLLGKGPVALSTAISTRNALQAKLNAGGTLTSSETTELASYTAMNLPSTGGYNKIAVNLNSALNTKASQLTAQANGFVYLSSLDSSINIKSVTSGVTTGDGNIRVTSMNNIYNVAGTGVVAISGRGAILEAANGVIGTADAPLLVNLGAGTLTARSEGNMYITQSALNTMNVAEVYSPSNVFLTAASGIRDARGASPLAVKAANITLSSSLGTIGTALNPLAVATVDTSATGGVVNATATAANMGIYLTRDTDATDTTHELRVGTLSAKGDIEVSSLAGLRVVGSITGGTTVDNHLTLQAGRDMALDGKITETGTLSLIASGNPATVTQQQAFQANALSLSGSTAAFSLWQPDNQINKLAANVGSLTIRDLDGYAITNVASYPTMGLSSSTLNGITASGGVYLTAAPMLGMAIVTSPTVTQDQAIVAGSLNLFGDNAVFNLGLGSNRLLAGSTPGSLTGKVSGLVFASNSAYSLSGLTGLSSLSLTVGTGVTATGVATLAAPSPLTTPLLTLNGPGSFNLLGASQNVAKLQTGTGALGLNTLSYRSDRLGALGALVASNSITLSTTGSLAQVAGSTVLTPTLTLQGVSGSYDLSLSNNDITNLVASTGNARLRDDNGFNLSSANVTGTLWLNSTTDVTQSAAITAGQLDLNGSNANYRLGGYSNAAGILKGATTTVTYKGLANYAVGALSFTTLDLASNSTVSQVGALTGTASSTLTLQGTGQFLLGSLNNTLGTLSNVGTAAAINFLGNTGFNLGALNATALTLQSNGLVTQSAAITAPTLTLASAAATGDFRLNSFSNTLNKVSGRAGALSLRDDGGFILGALNATALTLQSNGLVTQSAAITAPTLTLASAAATGDFRLNSYSNTLNNVSGLAGALSLRDDGGFILGALNATALTLQSNGLVTQTAAITAPTLTLASSAATGDFRLNSYSNTLNNVSGRAGALSLRDDGGFILGALNATVLTLQSNGLVTQSAAITAPTLTLASTAATGDFRLNSFSNTLNKVSGRAGALSLRDDGGFILGALSVTNQLTLVTAGSAAVTQTAAIQAGSLQLGNNLTPVAATGALSFSGVYNLNSYANSIVNLWGTGSSLKLWVASNLAIGGTTGLGLTGVLSLKSTASVTATATNLRASKLEVVGTTGNYDLTAALNATTATSMFAGGYTGTGASIKLVN